MNWILKRDGILGGKPYIRGTRLTVEFIREQIAAGASREQLLAAYPTLTPEALDAARRYTAQVTYKGVLRTHRTGRKLAKGGTGTLPVASDISTGGDR